MRMWGPASPADAVRVGPPGAPGNRIWPLAAGLDPDPTTGRPLDLAIDLSRGLVWTRGEAGWGAATALGGAVVEALAALAGQAAASAAQAAASAVQAAAATERAEAAEAAARQIEADLTAHVAAAVGDVVVALLTTPSPAMIAAIAASLAATLAALLPTCLPRITRYG
ncbi:MAG: hypothetical protein HZY79_15520 [Rhodoblastus sp.]|nr:MAG: hypothetical protein HZY79_15520 [Rhodoblastus sp.]